MTTPDPARGTPGDDVDRKWWRFARMALAAIVAAGIAMGLSFEYIERGDDVSNHGLEALLIVGLIPAWMAWAALAAVRFAQCGRLEYGVPVVAVLVVLAAHMLAPVTFGWYLDVVEPMSAAWAGLWFVFWLAYAALGAWLVWAMPSWVARGLQPAD